MSNVYVIESVTNKSLFLKTTCVQMYKNRIIMLNEQKIQVYIYIYIMSCITIKHFKKCIKVWIKVSVEFYTSVEVSTRIEYNERPGACTYVTFGRIFGKIVFTIPYYIQ